MKEYKYLIIGGGMTADSAVHGIRKLDDSGSIALISEEPDPPYNRPPLSKGLWKGTSINEIWRGTSSFHVDMFLGRRVTAVDLSLKQAIDSKGDEYHFEKCLFATGASPNKLPFDNGDIIYLRTLRHYQNLKLLVSKKQRFLVIGAGFIGSEIAAALALNHRKVTMLFPEEAIGGHVFPPDLSRFINHYYRDKGVDILSRDYLSWIKKESDHYLIKTENGRQLVVDAIVAGVGVKPNFDLAKDAGLKIGNGIIVDQQLRTSHPDVYAAGDVANFYNPSLDKRIRVEHEDNANHMGEMAGRALAGEQVSYTYLPYFYSDLFNLGYEAIGELNSKFETIAHWREPLHKGAIFYLDHGKIRGVLLWNLWKKIDVARGLIGEAYPISRAKTAGSSIESILKE
ncbi:MAG: pyridine nucleotide-disulfide oxidoreductase [Chloroflexi bacterium RBG_16_48_8]|nr:MAG: pyridine nucleotide-disulfide oxidoreductase [Chloroflexi bacterium RBG_16_48_8]